MLLIFHWGEFKPFMQKIFVFTYFLHICLLKKIADYSTALAMCASWIEAGLFGKLEIIEDYCESHEEKVNTGYSRGEVITKEVGV